MEGSARTLSTDKSNDSCEWGQHYTDIQQKRDAETQMNLHRPRVLAMAIVVSTVTWRVTYTPM